LATGGEIDRVVTRRDVISPYKSEQQLTTKQKQSYQTIKATQFREWLFFFVLSLQRPLSRRCKPSISVLLSVAMAMTLFIISVTFLIPIVSMFVPTMIAFPVSDKIPVSIVARRHPSRFVIWSLSPITFMPVVMSSHGVPVSLDPHELRSWSWRMNVNHSGRRRSANIDSNIDFRAECRPAQQYQSKQSRVRKSSHHHPRYPLHLLAIRGVEFVVLPGLA